MDYIELSIRIAFPQEVGEIIMREKQRFVLEFGSKYKSAPHITLYLARYSEDGVARLLNDLEEATFSPFTFELFGPKVNSDGDRNAYILNVSNKEEIEKLHTKIVEIASRYESPSLRDAEQERVVEGKPRPNQWYPHITLGTIHSNDPQPTLAEIEQNLHNIIGQQVNVSSFTIFVYGRDKDEERAKLIKEITMPF